jgi:outer membrane lipoprotein SlyB
MKYRIMFVLVAILSVALGGCATTPLSYQRYSSTENLQAQALAEGTVIRCQPIFVSNTQAQAAHGSLGAIVGGAAGYAIGASPIAAIAGVIGGAILGNVMTSGHVHGTEVMVKLTDGQLLGVPEVGNPGLHPGEQVAILRGSDGNTRAVPLH